MIDLIVLFICLVSVVYLFKLLPKPKIKTTFQLYKEGPDITLDVDTICKLIIPGGPKEWTEGEYRLENLSWEREDRTIEEFSSSGYSVRHLRMQQDILIKAEFRSFGSMGYLTVIDSREDLYSL